MKNYNPPPGKIYFLYQQFQKCYVEIQEKLLIQGVKIEFVHASEFSEQDFKTISQENPNMEIMVCVDDSSMATSKSSTLAHLFTVSRHYRISIVLFWHLLFPNTPQSRIIHQNTSYFFLLSSPRMARQIGIFGSQLNMRKALVDAYEDATKQLYGYILVDLTVNNPKFMQIRGNVFSEPQYVYVPSV